MQFDRKMTSMAKGFAIIFMLMHHLFGCAIALCEKYGVSEFSGWGKLYVFSIQAKVCVGIYVFLTAFGITRAYNKKLEKDGGNLKLPQKVIEKFSVTRYIKLEANFLFVYILAVSTSFLREGGIGAVYGIEGMKRGVMYGAIDALGLTNYFHTPSLNETWWYMSLAIFMVFLIPILIHLHKDYGVLLVVISGFIYYIGVTETAFIQYIFCITLGIWCAEEEILEKIYSFIILKNKLANSILKIIVYTGLIFFLFFMRGKTSYKFWIDAFIALLISCFCMELYFLVPIVGKVFAYLGKHSMNIFLIHTLIFEYYFTDFIYGFKNWILVLSMLVVSTLFASIMVERLKKIIRYNKLVNNLCKLLHL